MTYDYSLWITFLLIGLATTLPRGSFILLGARITLPELVKRALRYAPAAALAAIVVPNVVVVAGSVQPFNPKLAAAVVAVIVALRWRNPWLPFIAGMAVLEGLRWGYS
ncbi:MAG TPA: AzlD domain-containing protein [Burkholderiaceae bacterium]|jgi:branched-subunit amino acid transport protein